MEEKEELLFDENARFTMNPGEVEFLDEVGNVVSGDIKEFFEKQREELLTIIEPLKLGDVVKIKGTGQIVMVAAIDFKFNEVVKSQYAGTLFNSENENLILFNQEDIEKVYDSSLVELAQKKTR